MKKAAPSIQKKASPNAIHQREVSPFFGVQAKLTIGAPKDRYEKEADAMADQVIASESTVPATSEATPFFPAAQGVRLQAFPQISKKETTSEEEELQEKLLPNSESSPLQMTAAEEEDASETTLQTQLFEEQAIQTKCSECEQEEALQTQATKKVTPAATFETSLQRSKGSGTPMNQSTRQGMEQQFGANFEGVRIHTDAQAVQMNQDLGSQAFTNGSDIYFNQGTYQPQSTSGKHLLAHELTHTLQQGSVAPGSRIQTKPLSTRAFKGSYPLYRGAAPQVQAFGLSDVGDAFSAGADFIADTAGDAVEWAGETVSDIAEMGADALMSVVRSISPGLAELIEEGPMEMISEAMNGGIQEWLAGIFGELGIGEFITQLRENFEGVFAFLQGVATGDEASCAAFNNGIQAIRDFISDFMNNPFFQAIQSAFETVRSFLSEMFDLIVAPVLDFVLDLLGDAFSAVKDIATTIWGWISAVKDYMMQAWDWVMEQLGIGGEGEGGVWEWIKGFASDIWDEIKATFQPIIGPLQIILTILLVISPVGPLFIALTYGPRIVEAIQWLWANKDNPNIVEDSKEEMGGTILPQLLEAGQTFIGEINGVIDSMISTFVELHTALLEFMGAVTGIPLLEMARSFVETVSQGVQDFITWGQEKLSAAIGFISDLYDTISSIVRPYIEILTSIGLAILNPPMIPIILAGWAWRALPDCYKPPIIDFLLDGIIAFLEALPALPMMGPLWVLLKPFIIGFLQGFRSSTDAEKIGVTDKFAKIISGASIDFVIGFVVGILRGIWEGLTDPFVLLYQIISGLASLTQWFYSLINGENNTAEASGEATTASTPPSQSANGAGGQSTEGGAMPPNTQQALGARLSEMGGELQPPVETVTGNFSSAVSEYFQGGDSMTFDDLVSMMGDMWTSIEEGIRGAGSSLAESLVDAFMGEGAERQIGETVGWLAGTIVFELVLGYFTAGTYTAAKGVGKVLQYFIRFLDWTGEVMGIAFKMLGKLGKGVMKLFRKLVDFASNATGALRVVFDALREIGEKIIRFADELFGRFTGRAGGEATEAATERAAREASQEASERGTREGLEETAEEASERAARESTEAAGERGAREGVDDAAKAAELPMALAAAKTLTEANDVTGVPAAATVIALNATVKPQYRWIEYFEARPKGVGVYSIHMRASDHEVDSRYTDDNPIPNPTSRQRQFEEAIQGKEGLTPDELAVLREYNQLNPSGTLSVDDALAQIRAGKELNPNTGRFYDPNTTRRPDVEADIAGDRRVDHSDFSETRQAELDAIAESRRTAREAREEARELYGEGSPEYKAAQQEVVQHSEQLGETSSRAYMEAEYPGSRELPSATPGGKQGQFDMVYEHDGNLYVVEAKGGSSGLGSRRTREGLRAQQGTPEYRDDIIQNMLESGDPNVIATARRLQEAIADGNFKYLQVSQYLDHTTGDLVNTARVIEFSN